MNKNIQRSCGLNKNINELQIGFKTKFTLKYLFDYWSSIDEKNPYFIIFENKIKKYYDNYPDIFSDEITNIDFFENKQEALDDLLSIVISPISSETNISAAMPLFVIDPFYTTKAYKEIFMRNIIEDENIELEERNNIFKKVLLYVYLKILNENYDFNINYDCSTVIRLVDVETGSFKYYKTTFDDRFIKINKIKEIVCLTDEERRIITENLNNVDIIKKIVPANHFEICGFSIIHKTDVTKEEALSDLKKELLNKKSILKSSNFSFIQNLIRSMLCKPNIRLNLAAVHKDKVFALNANADHCDSMGCIYRESSHYDLSFFKNSVYETAYNEKKNIIVNNFPEYIKNNAQCQTNGALLAKNIKSLVVEPLFIDDKFVGICSLYSENLCEFDPINLLNMKDVYPLFALAIERALDDFDNEVQNIIQTNFTSIHPSIEWRFKNAAINLIENHNIGKDGDIEPIIFEDVYPLYCATDIRGSSSQRNNAIQTDLAEHLSIIKEVINSSIKIKPLPILDEFVYRIDKYINDLKDGLVSGDEIEIINFIHKDIEPCFKNLKEFGKDISDKIDEYLGKMDPVLGTLYKRRKDFDESVDIINKSISTYLDKNQTVVQNMFPHYFDKNTTDGVDQNIYIGQSLTEAHNFDIMYLRNLRLWQLIVLSAIGRITKKLIPNLRVPLETTHLIVVQDIPLTLIFKTDEKKLAVEGAYNIRYEIMKKRIDKAVVKDTGERLTQIGKIAIVYTQNLEAVEYKKYIEYLSAKGYLDNNIEELVLDELQGIKGLKALRVGINLNSEYLDEEDFAEIIGAIPI